MNILIVNNGILPVLKYGGTERVIWYLGRELSKLGHDITYLVAKGSHCPFGKVLTLDNSRPYNEQIPDYIDVVQFCFLPRQKVNKPYIVAMGGNINTQEEIDINTLFVSKNHAERYGSDSYIHNGLDWDEFPKPDLNNKRRYLHFLAKAAWKIKNVKAAIRIAQKSKEQVQVMGGHRINLNMGVRITLTPRARFCGFVDDAQKAKVMNESKGLLFPVLWHEPFGLSLTESLYFGCPVFGTPYGSLPEIITKEVGFLSNNEAELVQAVLGAGDFNKTRCHEYARDVFDAKTMTLKYVKRYEKVLNGETLNAAPPKLKVIQTEKFLEYIY